MVVNIFLTLFLFFYISFIFYHSEPQSAVHEFLSSGYLEQHHPGLEISDDLFILPAVQDINHGLELSSVMATAIGSEPVFTNFTATFKGTLDYIWYTPGRLKVLAVNDIPDPLDIFEQCGDGLPSACYPSDHVMLCTDLAFSLTGNGTMTRPGVHRRHLLNSNNSNNNNSNNSNSNNNNSSNSGSNNSNSNSNSSNSGREKGSGKYPGSGSGSGSGPSRGNGGNGNGR